MNDYIEFYSKHHISPVRQNIDNFNTHIKRREGLYRQLGLLRSSFLGKKVLEVGPGGGYNSLATYTFMPSKYVLIEPNITGYDELIHNFKNMNFAKGVEFNNVALENYSNDEKFDIVLCEGLVQGLSDKEPFLIKLTSFVKENGVLVITVADEISMFFEVIRRFLANELIKNEIDFKKQIDILVKAFKTHLDTLNGMTRRYDDWCADLICDAIYNHTFSIADAIEFFNEHYYAYGFSPDIIADYRWYKSLPFDTKEYNEYYIKAFYKQWHNLINSAVEYPQREEEKNRELSQMCQKLIEVIRSMEKNECDNDRNALIDLLKQIKKNIAEFDQNISQAIDEVIDLIQKRHFDADDVANMHYLKPLFGRGQVFLSFVKER